MEMKDIRSVAGLRDPGVLYNLGNALGFAAGLAVALWAGWRDEGALAWGRGVEHMVGSPAAVALTAATLVFFWGGVVYTKAWRNGAPPEPGLNRRGDILSGIGAIILGIGLVMTGNPWLAVSAGVLHAAGKFGSTLGGSAVWRLRSKSIGIGDVCKDLVLVSRVPAILVGTNALLTELASGKSADGLVLSLSFTACSLIWAVADWMLLSPSGWMKVAAGRVLPKGSGV